MFFAYTSARDEKNTSTFKRNLKLNFF